MMLGMTIKISLPYEIGMVYILSICNPEFDSGFGGLKALAYFDPEQLDKDFFGDTDWHLAKLITVLLQNWPDAENSLPQKTSMVALLRFVLWTTNKS